MNAIRYAGALWQPIDRAMRDRLRIGLEALYGRRVIDYDDGSISVCTRAVDSGIVCVVLAQVNGDCPFLARVG